MGREMPLSRGRQQPTSERRKGDRMSGLTQWEVTCGTAGRRQPTAGRQGPLASRLRTAPPAQCYRKRMMVSQPNTGTWAYSQKMDASGDIYFNLERPQQVPSSPTATHGADVPADTRSCALALKACPPGCNL